MSARCPSCAGPFGAPGCDRWCADVRDAHDDGVHDDCSPGGCPVSADAYETAVVLMERDGITATFHPVDGFTLFSVRSGVRERFVGYTLAEAVAVFRERYSSAR